MSINDYHIKKSNNDYKALDKIRTIFIGTPEFAVPSLKALVDDDFFDIIGVITQPDKKVGRKQVLTPPPVKVEAQKNNILVYQPTSIKNYELKITDPDLIIVVAYAQIIPESILNLPKYGCINVHGSLLPKYRGAACVQAAIANGDKKTGITIMKMDKGLDTGPIIFQKEIEIKNEDTAGSMFNKLSFLGAKTLILALKKYIAGGLLPEKQDDSNASYVGMLKKEDGRLRWFEDAIAIERFIRSRQPWPGAWTEIKDDGNLKIKINEVEHNILLIDKHRLGELFIHDEKLAIQCGKNSLVINKIQLEGKKELTAEEFLRGHKDFVGKVLN